jgi:hypothetical protein
MKPITTIEPKRLGVLIGAFNIAFTGAPESVDLVDRTRLALKALPDEIVRELGEAAGVLAMLAEERLGEGT